MLVRSTGTGFSNRQVQGLGRSRSTRRNQKIRRTRQ
nr:MAG TPA: hypothetical protein [Caudoviricetes sp.]